MNMHFLRTLLEEIDAIPVEDINERYGLLCELMAYVKKEASSPVNQIFRSTNILLKLLQFIEGIPEENREQRYFQLISLVTFIKRQAHLYPDHEAPARNRTAI